MARFTFTTSGYFVNLDNITAMKVKGQIGNLQSIEIWFAGSSFRDPGLMLTFKDADELFDELLKIHKMIGWTSPQEPSDAVEQ